jgi:hypothetical protein
MTSTDRGWEASIANLRVTGAELAVLVGAIRETRECLDDDNEFATRLGVTPAVARALADRLRVEIRRLQGELGGQ